MRTALASSALLVLAAGCSTTEFYNIAGYEQATFSNKADILFVVDNSSSMADEATALALNFDTFINGLAQSAPATDNLSDAVDNYTSFVTDRGNILDFQLGITTTTVDYATTGDTSGIDPGEAGRLLGDPTIITTDTTDIADSFTQNLLCDATCWSRSALDDDPTYVCGDDPGNSVSSQYLDCLCGADAWKDHCGAGTEEPLEATLDALCRASAAAPDLCWSENDLSSPIDSSEANSTVGFLRDDSTTVVVIVTDEGDTSRRMQNGDGDPTDTYLDYYDSFDLPLRVVAIGPDYDESSGAYICNSGGGTTWGAERLITTAETTGGFYRPIEEEESGECVTSNFSEHLNALGDLLDSLLRAFELASIPDTDTIRVYVEGVEIPEAPATTDASGNTTYGDGWSYDPSQNAVVFWGDAVPTYNEDVRIYYLPLEGKPRELPF